MHGHVLCYYSQINIYIQIKQQQNKQTNKKQFRCPFLSTFQMKCLITFKGSGLFLHKRRSEKTFLIINTREFATLQQEKTLNTSCVSLEAVDEPHRCVRNSLPAMFKMDHEWINSFLWASSRTILSSVIICKSVW